MVVFLVSGAHSDQGNLPSTLEAEKYVLKDKQGNVRAILGLTGDGDTMFSMFDRDRKLRHAITAGNEGGSVILVPDKKTGKPIASLSLLADRSVSLQLSAPGTRRELLFAVGEPFSFMEFKDEAGIRRLQIEEAGKGATVRYYDANGKEMKKPNAAGPLAHH